MIELFTKLASAITRNEGKKFLKLHSSIDDRVLEQPSRQIIPDTSLYIHIPFCRTLCPFCCFNRYLFKEEGTRQYFASLKRELSFYIDKGFQFSDFYFGGGTPTILMDELLSFTDFLYKNFTVKRISLETTPGEITDTNIRLLQQAGVNRLSIGVQSFDNSVVKAMGRVQCSGEEAIEKVLMAQGKFDTLNIDFVFNLPFQTTEQLHKDIAIFKQAHIDQATFYPLMASPHKKDAMERKFNSVDTSREKAFYEIILSELYDAGYLASTAWCFSRQQKLIDEYIIDFDDYIGIGSGSVSIYKGNFFVNTFSLEKYSALIQSGNLPIAGWRQLSRREQIYYYLLTKLFGITFDKTKFSGRFNHTIEEKLGMELLAMRLLKIIKGEEKIRVTRRGMYSIS
ncbi:MAG TPA: coproporphyrinogen III oxidase family protein, partial [Dehalococcoidia bacterium]|nr:coproporphyrinogen III oxidase family protein [Dehalococcoidia bacterium]